jgi:hypothetical protein
MRHGRDELPCTQVKQEAARQGRAAGSTRNIQQYNRVTQGKEQNAIRIARARKKSVRVPQAPDWKVVPGHASAIPAAPPSWSEPAGKKAGKLCR